MYDVYDLDMAEVQQLSAFFLLVILLTYSIYSTYGKYIYKWYIIPRDYLTIAASVVSASDLFDLYV